MSRYLALPRNHSTFKKSLCIAGTNHINEIWGQTVLHGLQEAEFNHHQGGFLTTMHL